MAPRLWDAYRTFNIGARDADSMFCAGSLVSGWIEHRGARCRWRIPDRRSPDEAFMKIRAILEHMEARPPSEALAMLENLLALTLCHEHRLLNVTWTTLLTEWRENLKAVEFQYTDKMELVLRRDSLSREIYSLTMEFNSLVTDVRAKAAAAEDSSRELISKCRALEQDKAALEEYKTYANETLAKQNNTVNCLRSELARWSQLAQGRQNELDEAESQSAEHLRHHHSELEELRSQLSDQSRHNLGLNIELEAARTEMSRLADKLANEHHSLDQFQKALQGAEMLRMWTLKELQGSRAQLETERQKSETLEEARSAAETKVTFQAEDFEKSQANLAAERQRADESNCALRKLQTEHELLAAQLLRGRQTSAQLQGKHDQAKTQQDVLIEQRELSQTAFEVERQKAETFSNELRKTTIRVVALMEQVEEQNSRALATEKAYSDDMTAMLEQVQKLEGRSLSRRLHGLKDKLNGVIRGFVS